LPPSIVGIWQQTVVERDLSATQIEDIRLFANRKRQYGSMEFYTTCAAPMRRSGSMRGVCAANRTPHLADAISPPLRRIVAAAEADFSILCRSFKFAGSRFLTFCSQYSPSPSYPGLLNALATAATATPKKARNVHRPSDGRESVDFLIGGKLGPIGTNAQRKCAWWPTRRQTPTAG
jgi:hypothetical protein